MNTFKKVFLFAFVLMLVASSVSAQTAQQGKTLAGLQRVYLEVKVSENNSKLGANALDAAEFQRKANLELRKTSVKVLGALSEVDAQKDGVLTMAFVLGQNTDSYDVVLQINLQQGVSLTRTNTFVQIPTWSYQSTKRTAAASVPAEAKALFEKAMETFLSQYLDANGK
ncbi:MAG: hypothetical protein IAF08_03585 [Rhizobacter sp.]|nr:hypothetical protein [Chlorobiales bacterium]